MPIGPTTTVKTEKRGQFERELLESEKYTSEIQRYTDLLTSASQHASAKAATQASYDITNAYANYLKQQRNIANQGAFEAGHKQELSALAQEQYQTSYDIARATQAQTYAKDYETAWKDYKTSMTNLYATATEEADTLATIYDVLEKGAGYDESKFPFYEEKSYVDDQGVTRTKLDLTSWGRDAVRKYALAEGSTIKADLEKAGVLDYFLSNKSDVLENLFGITETDYRISDESIAQSTKDYYGTAGFIESVEKPKSTFNWNDAATIDFGKTYESKKSDLMTEVSKYIENVGLQKEDVTDILEQLETDLDAIALANTKGAIKFDVSKSENLISDAMSRIEQKAREKYISKESSQKRKADIAKNLTDEKYMQENILPAVEQLYSMHLKDAQKTYQQQYYLTNDELSDIIKKDVGVDVASSGDMFFKWYDTLLKQGTRSGDVPAHIHNILTEYAKSFKKE
jgi:hypothetical protein